MKEYLNPKESLEGKAKDALTAEGNWDKEFLNDRTLMNSVHNSALLKNLSGSYVSVAVFLRFYNARDQKIMRQADTYDKEPASEEERLQREKDGLRRQEIVGELGIFRKNFEEVINEREYLSGGGIVRFVRAAYAVWSCLVSDRQFAFTPERMEELGLDDKRIMETIAHYVRPSAIDVDQDVFKSSIRPKLIKLGFYERMNGVVFDGGKPLSCLVEELAKEL